MAAKFATGGVKTFVDQQIRENNRLNYRFMHNFHGFTNLANAVDCRFLQFLY